MRSRYLTALVSAVAMSLVFVSCDSFFNTNLFKSAGFGQVSAETLKGESSDELVDDAYTDTGDPSTSFFEALAGDSTVRGEVLATLEETYTSPTASPTAIQEAASLAAQIELVTSGADDLVNNVADHYSEFSALSTVEEAIDLVKSLIPAGLSSDAASFASAIAALLSADDAYTALGGSIASDGLSGDINIGTAAQSALAAAALSAIDATSLTDPDTGSSYTSQADYLWDFLQGTTTATPDHFSLDTSASTPLGSILAEAGLSIDPISF